MRAEPVTDPVAHHGEGPVWDARLGRVCWVDLLAGDILSTGPEGGDVDRRHVASVAACVVPRAVGGLAVATERGFTLIDAGGDAEVLPDVWTDPGVRMNDGACDPQGRFYSGSMSYDGTPGRGALYRLDPDRHVEQVLGPVTTSNGLEWTLDGSAAYYVDSRMQRIDLLAFDAEAGRFTDRSTVVEIAPGDGAPDGLTTDAEGGIWVALWRGGAVRRYAPDGTLDAVVELPVRQPTSCAFGGHDLDVLFVSTSALDLDDPEPLAGALFALRPRVRGRPPHAFAG